jgi:hypothetical protein
VHGVLQKDIERSFREHQTRFHEGKHCYLLDFAEASQLLSSIGAKANPYGLGIFTEAGYLLLVKPMRDDLAWQVQERMIEAYKRAIELCPELGQSNKYKTLRDAFASMPRLPTRHAPGGREARRKAPGLAQATAPRARRQATITPNESGGVVN